MTPPEKHEELEYHLRAPIPGRKVKPTSIEDSGFNDLLALQTSIGG